MSHPAEDCRFTDCRYRFPAEGNQAVIEHSAIFMEQVLRLLFVAVDGQGLGEGSKDHCRLFVFSPVFAGKDGVDPAFAERSGPSPIGCRVKDSEVDEGKSGKDFF